MPSGVARGKDAHQPAILLLNSLNEHALQNTEKLRICEHNFKHSQEFDHVQKIKFVLDCKRTLMMTPLSPSHCLRYSIGMKLKQINHSRKVKIKIRPYRQPCHFF